MTAGGDVTFVGGDNYSSPPPPVVVSDEHASQLREAASTWLDELSSWLEPDWAVHALEEVYFKEIDSDEGFLSLRQHFSQLNGNYAKWRTMNKGLRGVDRTLYWMNGGSGFKPTTGAGMAALRSHNDVLWAIVAELTEIQARVGITGECDQCKKAGSS